MLELETIKEILDSDDVYERLIRPVMQSHDVRLIEQDYPGIAAEEQLTELQTRHLVARGMRQFAGTDSWTNSAVVCMQTIGFMEEYVYAYSLVHLSRGMYVGDHLEEWNKLPLTHRFHRINCDPDFTTAAELLAVSVNDIEGMHRVLMDKFSQMLASNTLTMGYMEMEGHDLVHVWDLWRITLQSAGLAFYTYGMECGRIQNERDQFDAIVALETTES